MNDLQRMKDQHHDLLDRMQFQADPLADETMAKIIGDWHDLNGPGESADGAFSPSP